MKNRVLILLCIWGTQIFAQTQPEIPVSLREDIARYKELHRQEQDVNSKMRASLGRDAGSNSNSLAIALKESFQLGLEKNQLLTDIYMQATRVFSDDVFHAFVTTGVLPDGTIFLDITKTSSFFDAANADLFIESAFSRGEKSRNYLLNVLYLMNEPRDFLRIYGVKIAALKDLNRLKQFVKIIETLLPPPHPQKQGSRGEIVTGLTARSAFYGIGMAAQKMNEQDQLLTLKNLRQIYQYASLGIQEQIEGVVFMINHPYSHEWLESLVPSAEFEVSLKGLRYLRPQSSLSAAEMILALVQEYVNDTHFVRYNEITYKLQTVLARNDDLGARAKQTILWMLQSKQAPAISTGLSALEAKEFSQKEVLELVSPFFMHPSDSVRWTALNVVGKRVDAFMEDMRSLIPQIEKLQSDSVEDVASYAKETLEKIEYIFSPQHLEYMAQSCGRFFAN